MSKLGTHHRAWRRGAGKRGPGPGSGFIARFTMLQALITHHSSLITAVAFGAAAASFSARDAHAQTDSLFAMSRAAMGSTFDIALYAPNGARARELFEAAFEEVERIEALLSNYRLSSELSRLNATASSSAVTTDPEVFGLLEHALAYSRASNGAFDITVGRLMGAWGFFRGEGRYPAAQELDRARAQTGWRHLELDAAARTVHFLVPGLSLDLGSIGKGYAVDCVADLLRGLGVTAALVGAGTSSYFAIGSPPGEKGWRIRVRDPFARSQVLSVVVLRDQSLSTSGNYEKFFDLDGRRYSHIMDPRSGRPVEERVQVTVIAPRGTDSNALSVAVFVLGESSGRELLATVRGASALVIEGDARNPRVIPLGWTERGAAVTNLETANGRNE